MQRLDHSLEEMLAVQGGCERIKKTPMPRGYGFIAERLIWAYGLLFPFAMVEEIGWLVVPINVLVCLSFTLISEVGPERATLITFVNPAVAIILGATVLDEKITAATVAGFFLVLGWEASSRYV